MLIYHREGNGGRTLQHAPEFTAPLTVAKCIAACKDAGSYQLAGLEYAGECCMKSEPARFNCVLANDL